MRSNTKAKISDELHKIEKNENIVIFYACESGSRAWGFESKDSDYDVRFLYLHPPKWYLSIEKKREVIEKPISDELDISGWDIKKALLLFRKSNPPLLEWLQSGIVYKENFSIAEKIRGLMKKYYSPKSCLYHYLHMAHGNFKEFLKGEDVWVKKYFYVLRPILACKWIEEDLGLVPMEFEVLVKKTVKDSALNLEIENLLNRKKSGEELDRGPKIPVLNNFLEKELERLSVIHARPSSSSDIGALDQLFHKSLIEVWGETI